MKCLKQGLLIASLLATVSGIACTKNGKEGFVPENNLRISVYDKRAGGISQAQFNAVIDRAEKLYAPIISTMGGELKVNRGWDDGTVNAYAQQDGKTWMVSMFGGLARHETITEDGFALVICHEIGHHIGGAPKIASYWSDDWASNEGQSDYFANLKCLRRSWQTDDNQKIVKAMTNVPANLKKKCNAAWKTAAERALCVRGAMAGDSVARLFAALRSESPAKFETPDSKVVAKTDDRHPGTQCRLDTYFQGSLCKVDFNNDVSNESEITGTCHSANGDKGGLRPLCWFKPSVQ